MASSTPKLENAGPYCSHESCQELHKRVESLEETVKAIISSLSVGKNPNFATFIKNMVGNQVEQLPEWIDINGNNIEEIHQPTTNLSNSQPKSDQQKDEETTNSVYHIKHAVKCSLAHMLDINVSEINSLNKSAGILNVTLHRPEGTTSLEINWSPPSAVCLEFITGLWIRVYESGTSPALFKPYLSIPRKCLKSKQHPFGRKAFSIFLPSSNSSITEDADCHFPIQTLVVCRSYNVEVVPNYQSLRGKSIQSEVIIPPTLNNMTLQLESSINVSVVFDSLTLNWEDNSGCTSRLTSINLRLWPDELKTASIEPISYKIPRSCLKHTLLDGNNLFSVTLSSSSSSPNCRQIQFKPLDKCRKYLFEMESQYSYSLTLWTGPAFSQTIFTTAVTHPNVSLPDESLSPFTDDNQLYYGIGYCYDDDHFYCESASTCISVEWLCDGVVQCRAISPLPEYQDVNDESYCDPWCFGGFSCGIQCVPEALVCDGKKDCYNGEDETSCDDNVSKITAISPPCQYLTSSNGSLASVSREAIALSNPTKSGNTIINQGPTTALISVKPNQIIWMDFAKLNSEKRTIVKMYDGPYSTSPLLLLSHDDLKRPSSVRSTGPNLYIEYYSYQDEIHAYYTTMEKPEQKFVDGCGGYVNGDGVISSPNWGKGLTINGNANEHPDDCFWFIEARHDGETLLLKRDTNEPLELDVVIQQFHNPIIVYDGWSSSGVVLYDDRIKKRNNDSIYSSSSKMMVQFYRPFITNPLKITNSWNVTTIYTPHCKENLTGSYTGVVKSTNYPAPYPKSSDCRWTISTEPGSTIRLLFAFFETRKNKDIVYVYGGPTVYHPLLMERSGTASTPLMVNSSSNQVLVRFTSSDAGELNSSGFLAVYSVV